MPKVKIDIIQNDLNKFILDYNKKNIINFNEKTNIFEEGILDSFGFVELISFCEKKYQIDISNINFFEEFKNISKISKYIINKIIDK